MEKSDAYTDTDKAVDDHAKTRSGKKERKKKHKSCFWRLECKPHKAEVYVKPEVDKNICRDRFCKDHFEKPIIMQSANNIQPSLPPPPPPHMVPYYHQQRPMYPMPPVPLYPYDGMFPFPNYPRW
ncbi:hypothetical protein QVD17_02948 [Tagetes erecta]|uniref:Uncharacterized protein n=1 Tax=Tagetes erecta TaxID=13708 RepID=A0AAD8P9G8_TARER|nr:hypothetical protein QVD17_02948 [Tagetes erecta]